MQIDKREGRTIFLIGVCYGGWFSTTFLWEIISHQSVLLGIVWLLATTTLFAAFHTSLQHEVVHGHPTPFSWINEALVFFPLAMVFPFRRYKALHLKHHDNTHLTDPYEDPESYYWPEASEKRISRFMFKILAFNNTFLGRMVVGPALSMFGFFRTEIRRILKGEPGVAKAWILHLIGAAPMIYWVAGVCGIPLLIYFFYVVYPALSWVLVRSFAEHQAAEEVGHRSAIVETNRFFQLLYLNNNLHLVHHAHPQLPWYDLPVVYRERKQQFLAANDSYLFTGYGQIATRFALSAKQSVFHPLWYRMPTQGSADHPSGNQGTKPGV